MTWSRRVFGVVLSSMLLLMVALPAVCGNCQAMAAKADCAEDHGGKAKDFGRSSSGYSICDHCDESQGMSAYKQIYQTAPEPVLLLPQTAKMPRLDSNRIATVFAAASPVTYVQGACRKYIFIGKSPVPDPVYYPLTVSLKI